jgi:hypothetical protein
MSTITARDDSVSKPPQYMAPKSPIWKQINGRMVLLIAIIILPVFAFFYQWARQAFYGGIIFHDDYAEVNLKAMSSFDMDQSNGQPSDIPGKFRNLEGRRVLLVGEMWAAKDAGDGNLNYFQLVYSRTKCCFSGPPLAQHFVDSNVKPGALAEYSDGMVRVWGTLHIKFRKEGPVIKSVYEVDVDKVEEM